MADYSYWLILAGVLLVSEILTGTFYLIMVAIGAFLAAIVAYFGYSIELQIVTASVFSVIASLVLQNIRRKRQADNQQTVADNLDAGNLIEVSEWNAHGLAKVMYRGAFWQAKCIDEQAAPGLYQISELNGNTLLLTQHKTKQD